MLFCVFFFKQKTAYEMRISDWSSDVCSSDLEPLAVIDSPELRSKLVQEESTLASMEAEASRAVLDAQIARAAARKVVQQAEISRTAAQRDLERYQRAYEGGAVSQNELATAQEQLKKAENELASAKKDFDQIGKEH